MLAHHDIAAEFRRKAAQCRTVAADSRDPEDVRWLLLRGLEFDRKAAELAKAPAPRC